MADQNADGDAAVESTVASILQAIADPVRLEIVRRIAAAGSDLPCGQLYEDVSKSTASYHFSMLRTAGVIEQYMVGVRKMNRLRIAELEATCPGVLSSVLANLAAEQT